ncbi:MAG TPA: phosphatase PAP2 family protein [Gemmatimonadaceae bacterium]|nr:phosphatase PAP2 family protein [Gemmatimonadaceae bacterium]
MTEREPTGRRDAGAAQSPERRGLSRGHLTLFWNLMFRALRKVGSHAESFYTVVGIFLLIGAAIAVAGTLAFAELGEHIRKGSTQQFDVAVLQWIGARHTPFLSSLMTEVTPLGTGAVVLVVVGVAAAFLWHTEHKHSARLLLASTAGGILLNNVLKLWFDRPRPTVFAWETHAASSSFPSGHAMSATVVYGTVAYLLARLQKHRWSRALTLTTAVVLIALICATRLYLGVHYPSDVLGGIVIGLAWAGFCMATLEASLVLARRRAPDAVVEELPTPKEQSASVEPPPSEEHAVTI